MLRDISHRWAEAVTRHWKIILVSWILLAAGIRLIAPAWNEIAYDGDFEYLPATMTSVAGGQLLDEAFPGERSRSQIVLVVGRSDGKLSENDELVGLDLLRRLYHRLAEVSWQRAIDYGYSEGPVENAGRASAWVKLAREALDESLKVDEEFYTRIAPQLSENDVQSLRAPRMAIAHWDRGKLFEQLGETEEAIGSDFEAALVLQPDLPRLATPIAERELEAWDSLIDVLSWKDKVIGSRMANDSARLAVMQLSSELAETKNIKTVEAVSSLVDEVKSYSLRFADPGLQIEVTGSAAIGGETLIAARDAIRYTEWITVAMILLILATVYRSPFLVAIPMISIGLAVLVSTSLVALLTSWSINGTVPGLDLRVFTTSRIFIVVILFGAGTDYCLFLIARLREEALKADWVTACKKSLSGVSGALIGSAFTTIVGLGMLWFARFGKFHYTGPIIAICLMVGLLVCMTLTPALLRGLGPIVFWPNRIEPEEHGTSGLMGGSNINKSATVGGGLWNWIALMVTRRPLAWLTIGALVLAMPGVYGLMNEDTVTYDLSSQLNQSASSRRGLRLLSKHFRIGEINPVTVLMVRPEGQSRRDLEKEIKLLSDELHKSPGVAAVRNSKDPLGEFPPDRSPGLFSSQAWKRRALQKHRIAQGYFFSSDPKFENRLARLDVIFDGDPFSIETAEKVSQLGERIYAQTRDENSSWNGSTVLFTGTTPSIIDLRSVTLSDNRRIKVAVVVAVLIVLIVVIRRVGLCCYLIATVLLSYYATLGLTLLFFKGAYGTDFVGLDWKLPIFLFVILVAVGQDYNVYLVTRIIEEQRSLGWLMALRRAVARTGGIITACGLVMAATFFSMTSSAWLPIVADTFGISTGGRIGLRGIIELGFALGLGVLIDTFYVRTILVPSFVALVGKRNAKASSAANTS